MRLYISAPMLGVPGYNFHAFDAAAVCLDFMHHDPISPADHDRELYPDIETRPEYAVGAPMPGMRREELLGWDFKQIIDSDGIVMLPGWENSVGANHELRVARATGKRILYLVTAGSGIGQPWIEGAELRLLEPPAPIVVGLSGYGQTGKSTAGLALSALGFTEVGTGDAIRDALYALNPSIKVKGHWPKLQTHVDQVGWETAKVLPGVRALLQRFGTEVAEIIDEDMWAAVVRRHIDHAYDGFDTQPAPARYVVSSVRRVGDAKSVAGMNGEVWRIERAGYGPINNHKNETELDAWPFDARIVNEGSDLTLFTNVIAETACLRGLLDPTITERLLAFFGADTPLEQTAS